MPGVARPDPRAGVAVPAVPAGPGPPAPPAAVAMVPAVPAAPTSGLAGLAAVHGGGAGPGPNASAPAPTVGGPAVSTDHRVLTIGFDTQGKRHRNSREATRLLFESPMPDWWLTGPRTTLWLCKFWVDNQGDPMAWFAHFMSTGKLSLKDGGI